MTAAQWLTGREMCDEQKDVAGWVHEGTHAKLKGQFNSKGGGKPLGAFEGGSDRSKELPQRWAWLLGGERIGGSGTSCAHHGGMCPPVPVIGTGQTGEPDSHLPFGILQLEGHSV